MGTWTLGDHKVGLRLVIRTQRLGILVPGPRGAAPVGWSGSGFIRARVWDLGFRVWGLGSGSPNASAWTLYGINLQTLNPSSRPLSPEPPKSSKIMAQYL